MLQLHKKKPLQGYKTQSPLTPKGDILFNRIHFSSVTELQ